MPAYASGNGDHTNGSAAVGANGQGNAALVPVETPRSNGMVVYGDGGGPAAPYASVPTSPPAALGILRSLRHRWKLATLVGVVLGACAAVSLWFLMPAGYTAVALLQVASTEPRILPEQNRSAGAGTLESNMYQRAQLSLLKSRVVVALALDSVVPPGQDKVRNLGIVRVQQDPAGWLEDTIKASYLDNTDLMRVSLTSPQAEDAAVVVNAVVEAYLKEIVEAERNRKRSRLDDLQDAYQASEEKIRTQKERLRKLAEALKTSDTQVLSQKQRLLLDQYASLNRELATLQSQLRTTQVKVATLQAQTRPDSTIPVPDHLVEQAVDGDSIVSSQLHEVYAIADQINRYKQFSKIGNVPEKLTREHQQAKERLEKIRDEVRVLAKQRVQRRLKGEAVVALRQAEDQTQIMKQQYELVNAEVEKLRKEVESMGISSIELELKKAEIEQAERVVKALWEEKERLQVELQSSKRRVNVIHKASTPDRKDLKLQMLGSSFGGLFGLMLGLLGVSLMEFRQGRITTTNQVVRNMGLRVVGTVPVMPRKLLANGKASNGRTSGHQQNLLVESIDGIRTMLLCDQASQGCWTVMITSANSREGKTFLASHLATSVAHTGRRTLLMDCDLRRPSIQHVFDIPLGPGLSEVLRGEVELQDAARAGPVPGLTLLTAGKSDRRAIQALARDGTRQLFERLRTEYDFIVVDSCPVLPVADSLLVSKHVDTVVISVRPSVSQTACVLAAYERLQSLGVQILGTIVNGDPSFADSIYYEPLEQS